MQEQTAAALIRLIAELLDTDSKKKILFLMTASDREESILDGEMNRLLEQFPDSWICMDEEAEECYPAIAHNEAHKAKMLKSKGDIRREVALADEIAVLSLDLSTLRKTALGICDSNVTCALMEALLLGKKVIASDSEVKSRITQAKKEYRQIFEDAKNKTESYGVVFEELHQIQYRLKDITTEEEPKSSTIGKKQVVTVKELLTDENLVIEKGAIVTPAARELLAARKK